MNAADEKPGVFGFALQPKEPAMGLEPATY